MDINSIKKEYDILNRELKSALSRMELTDQIFTIREQIHDLQKLCPHDNGNYNFSHDAECPYCGKKFGA